LPTFYPGEIDFDSAVPVDLEPGETRLNLNIRFRSEKGLHIRGIVLNESGKPMPYARVYVSPEGGALEGIDSSSYLLRKEAQVEKDGTFDIGGFPFGGLPPGTYVLKALGTQDASLGESGRELNTVPDSAVAFGSQSVTLVSANVDGVVIRLRDPQPISGRVRFEDGSPVGNVSIRFRAEPSSEVMLLRDFIIQSGPDGSLTYPNAWPTKYDVSVSGLPPGAYLSSITSGDQNLQTSQLDNTTREGTQIEVLLSPSAAGLKGVVKNLNGSVIKGAQVFAWSKMPVANSDFAGASTSTDGSFAMGNLAPGDYYVASTEAADIQLMRDPRFREAFLPYAVSVALDASSHKEGVNLQVVPWDQVRRLATSLR
jgi:hypothetical protein